jgi:uncharacterized protein (DUF1015 family)
VSFEIAPLRALRFGSGPAGAAGAGPADLSRVVAPPYDVISPEEHRALLERSPHNIVRLTLGDRRGADYRERAALLSRWREEGILREEGEPAFHVYGVDYLVPGSGDRRASFRGLLALGSLHDFSEKVVLPHEQTFADVVDDRYRLLEATRTHLELILLLYSDARREIDAVLEEACRKPPELRVEARPGETHALWTIRSAGSASRLTELFRRQRPIIADGHHRYTTACLYRKRNQEGGSAPGAGWQPMVLGNLFGEGLSILATHRLVSVGGRSREALAILGRNLEEVPQDGRADLVVETREEVRRFAIPVEVRTRKRGVGATSYAILHDLILGEWLQPLLSAAQEGQAAIQYWKEGTGEREALHGKRGDLLFRMRPVNREEFRAVVEGGETFPHKTTFFYPKLWSGLALWAMAEPGAPPGLG